MPLPRDWQLTVYEKTKQDHISCDVYSSFAQSDVQSSYHLERNKRAPVKNMKYSSCQVI